MKKYILSLIAAMVCLLVSEPASAQFFGGDPAGSQDSYNQYDDSDSDTSSTAKRKYVSVKQYFRALGHKDTIPITPMWAGSIFLPGTAQIYNKDYWKLPILYGGVAGFTYGAYHNNMKWLSTGDKRYETQRNLMIAGAALVYWGSIVDGLVSYNNSIYPNPSKATLYSAMFPGLGQAYNGDYWKIPIIYGGLAVTTYLWTFYGKQYQRFRQIYIDASNPDSGYKGSMTAEDAKWRRDVFRRYRDYSMIATVLVYALNVIDAHVFSYMQGFEIDDDLSMSVTPSIMQPLVVNSAMNNSIPGVGLSVGVNF